ncbi:MAG: phage replisome organizer N-terminal domain-containing protein [Erysipelotrichaceae bacterium]|nr:phage replisome organizer N-terminal domain-containing protein [Erysipelotrichaceae bacterium]
MSKNGKENKHMEQEKKIRSGSRRYYWMRLKSDFFESPEIKKLRKLAGGDTYTIIYQKMMLKTLQDDGVFIYKGIEDTFEKEVALIIDEDENNVMMTIAYLRAHNLLEEGYSENEFLLKAVPGLIGSETKDAERKRIARSMEQKAVETIETDARTDIVRQLSANVRNCPTEIEKEIEIEEEYIRTDSDSEQEQNMQEQKELEQYEQNGLEQYTQNQNGQELVQGHISAETETYEQYETRIICVLEEEQYAAWRELLRKMQLGELKTTRSNLTRYFEQMMKRDWKDYSGKPIRNIVSYVEMNFAAHARDRDIAREKLKEEGFEPGSEFIPYRKMS